MFGIESLSGNAHAAAIVGLVLLEALVLYGGYGALVETVGSTVLSSIQGE